MPEEYAAIRFERLYMKIVEQIQGRILAGELKLGDTLPSERDLAEQFHVSRTAVREAVKTLSEKGLVEVHPGRGTFITNGTTQVVRSSLGMMIRIGQPDGTQDLVEVREIFEPEIAVLAAVRAGNENIAAMQRAVEIMDQALDNAEAFIEADLDFHLSLAEAAQNTVILALIDFFVDLLREQRKRIFFVEGGPQRGQMHHKRILEAVIRHDPAAAREEMRSHLQQVREDSEAAGLK